MSNLKENFLLFVVTGSSKVMQSFYLVGSASYPTGVGLLLTTLGPGQISTEMERKEKKTFHGC